MKIKPYFGSCFIEILTINLLNHFKFARLSIVQVNIMHHKNGNYNIRNYNYKWGIDIKIQYQMYFSIKSLKSNIQ